LKFQGSFDRGQNGSGKCGMLREELMRKVKGEKEIETQRREKRRWKKEVSMRKE